MSDPEVTDAINAIKIWMGRARSKLVAEYICPECFRAKVEYSFEDDHLYCSRDECLWNESWENGTDELGVGMINWSKYSWNKENYD